MGAGNAPALVDETCDLGMAASFIVTGKTFDNGMICAAEQAVVVVDAVHDEMLQLLQKRGVHFLDEVRDSACCSMEAPWLATHVGARHCLSSLIADHWQRCRGAGRRACHF